MLLLGAKSCQAQFNMRWFSPIPSTLYGPNYHTYERQQHFIFDLIRKILIAKKNNQQVNLWGDGNQRREIIHVNDFSKLLIDINEKFENEILKTVGSSYAVAANSATSCLHLACKALDLKENEWVWTSPNSFVASANAALYCGANIDFVDIDPFTYNMSCEKLEEKLIMNLRISKNIPVSIFDYEKLTPVVFHLEENKLIKTKDNKIVIRTRGKKMLDYIFRSLVECF